MAALNSCIDFPPREAFFNDLQQKHIDQNDYEDARNLFNAKMQSGEWKNFADYLQYYNLLDVVPLLEAVKVCFSNYKKYFEIDALNFLSLPSIGFTAMYNLFDQRLPFVSSFNVVGDEVRQLFRNNVVGGLSSVFHRYCYVYMLLKIKICACKN